MSMPRLTIVLAVILIAIGVGFWLGTGMQSVTALIPAFLGIALNACGVWARREGSRAVAMHLALVIALMGFAGAVPGVLKLVKHLGGEESAHPAALLAQTIVAALCLIYLILGVNSFVQARRRRNSGD